MAGSAAAATPRTIAARQMFKAFIARSLPDENFCLARLDEIQCFLQDSGGAQPSRHDIADDANLPLQYEHGAMDQSSPAHRLGAIDAAAER